MATDSYSFPPFGIFTEERIMRNERNKDNYLDMNVGISNGE